MTVYQILVEGSHSAVDGRFTRLSKEVFIEKPSQKVLDEFVEKCTDRKHLFALDKEQPYEVKLLELELVGDIRCLLEQKTLNKNLI